MLIGESLKLTPQSLQEEMLPLHLHSVMNDSQRYPLDFSLINNVKNILVFLSKNCSFLTIYSIVCAAKIREPF